MIGTFEEYAAARWSRLVRSAVLMGADPHAAEDLVQTALAKCYFAWARVSRAQDPDAYVHRVLINTLTDSRRRRWWGESPAAELPEPSVADGAEERASGDALRAALRQLALPQRQVLVLRYYADLTEAQVAAALGIPVGTVKSRAARGLAVLEADPSLGQLVRGEGR
ncbi:RNA polymerase sigma-70 factor (sigma-E family) [Nocardioides ginsengisegetis]|uniref:RNA polymerase sigma-70 factor (Sigma-E family) n=1 Tax=Nocardioides ginsengisegetis TaxID=661491 RepID=A0A7W3IX12_9ACTN|nr:SigE family RNA polymerase sigma factor [Nocardioides ginsengisegetis]MBA8802225.1 RNA polymerase sigma-70 factor (sigma-E family) [Nocardioides ginsengisegetis]